jgi:hypothetical protein
MVRSIPAIWFVPVPVVPQTRSPTNSVLHRFVQQKHVWHRSEPPGWMITTTGFVIVARHLAVVCTIKRKSSVPPMLHRMLCAIFARTARHVKMWARKNSENFCPSFFATIRTWNVPRVDMQHMEAVSSCTSTIEQWKQVWSWVITVCWSVQLISSMPCNKPMLSPTTSQQPYGKPVTTWKSFPTGKRTSTLSVDNELFSLVYSTCSTNNI